MEVILHLNMRKDVCLSKRWAQLVKSHDERLTFSTVVGLRLKSNRTMRAGFLPIWLIRPSEYSLRQRVSKNYTMANQRQAWWVPKNGPQGRISFNWPGIKGSRQLQGLSTKRQVHWHFGISTAFRSVPFYHARVKSRLIFSMDGKEVIASSARMHRLRRSSAKRWRNVSFERHANELPVLVR